MTAAPVAVADVPTRTQTAPQADALASEPVVPAAPGDDALDPSTGQNRVPHPAPVPGLVPEFGVKTLGNFTYVDGDIESVPADIMALAGTPVTVYGYMLPTRQTDTIREFLLVEDVEECCFGTPPGLEHLIKVTLPADKAVGFVFDQIAVTGTLRVREDVQEGYVVNLMEIDDVTSVRDVGPM